MEKRIRRKTGKPLRVSSQFNIGSMTKGFTAAAILKICGRSISCPSAIPSPFFSARSRSKRGISPFSIPHTHLGAEGTFGWHGIMRRDGAVTRYSRCPSSTHRGLIIDTRIDDYKLLAAIIEVASGAKWEDYIKRELLEPRACDLPAFRAETGATRARTECEVRRETCTAG